MSDTITPLHPPAPEPGEAIEIAERIFWARLPIPFPLKDVNVWLLDEGDGWTVIDTGCADRDTPAIWEKLLDGPMHGKPILRIVGTHGHVDHVGLSGWLAQKHEASFLTTLGEWLIARQAAIDPPFGRLEHALRFYRRHGCPSDAAWSFTALYRRAVSFMGPIPPALIRLRDGQTVRLAGRDWTTMVSGGHAPEHLSLYCRDAKLLIVGDHVLPRITPIISVHPEMPEADPLRDYLESFARFRALPSDVLVLPSHGSPYVGLRNRLDELERHHDGRLAALLGLLESPAPVYELAQGLFPQAFARDQGGLAFAETLAHLNYLLGQGRLARHASGDTVLFGLPLTARIRTATA